VGHIQQSTLRGSSLHMGFDPLLTLTITSFNLSLIVLSTPATFHCQCVVVIAGGIYMAVYGIHIA